MQCALQKGMEIIIESVAWVALGFAATIFALKAVSKSRELKMKAVGVVEVGREGRAMPGVIG